MGIHLPWRRSMVSSHGIAYADSGIASSTNERSHHGASMAAPPGRADAVITRMGPIAWSSALRGAEVAEVPLYGFCSWGTGLWRADRAPTSLLLITTACNLF